MSKDTEKKCPVKVAPQSWVPTDPGYKTIAGTFMASSTIHGVSHLGSSGSRCRRVVWLLLFLASVVFLIFGIKANLHKMRQYGVVMKATLRHSNSLPFPALTLCNANTIRKSKARETVLQDFFIYSKQGKNSNVDTSQPIDLVESLNHSGHDIRDMLKECFWNGQRCGPENFTASFDMKVGKCYTFNSRTNEQLSVNDGGIVENLVLTLDVQPEEYYDPWNNRVGFRVQLHESGKKPEVFRRGQLITPGFSYNMAITRHKTTLLPDPHPSGCVKDRAESYSVVGCQDECWDRIANGKCNCTTSGIERRTVCTIEQATCLSGIKAEPVKCPCPPPCVSVTYQTDLSGALFPAPHQWPHIFKQYNMSSSNDTDAFKKTFRERYVKLSAYYQTLGTKEWEELPAYDLDNFFSDLGGMMGLCLGCSLMSVLELLDLVVSLLVHFAYKSRSTKVHEYPY